MSRVRRLLGRNVLVSALPRVVLFAHAAAFLGLAAGGWALSQGSTPASPAARFPRDVGRAAVLDSSGGLPMSFEENRGQTDGRVKFLSRGPGYTLFLTERGAVFSLESASIPRRGSRESGSRNEGKGEALTMRLIGARANARATGLDDLPGKTNYFIGNDPSQWRTDVPTYRRVKYEEIYEGIDLLYYGEGGRLEFDFLVAPGADPSRIRLEYEGGGRPKIDLAGDLVIRTATGNIRFHKPLVFQRRKSGLHAVKGGFRLRGGRQAGFAIGAYDRRLPLTIDPVLSYATLIGPAPRGNDFYSASTAVAVDTVGNAYVVGTAASERFPVTSGPFATKKDLGGSGFVLKLDPTGSRLLYSTFLGSFSYCNAVAVDALGNAYVTGIAEFGHPTTPGAYQEIGGFEVFVTKLNATGSALLYSTGLGGSSLSDGVGIAVNDAGEAFVAGNGSLIATPGAFRSGRSVFVVRLNAAGSQAVYAATIGGSGLDRVAGIAIDDQGNAYIEGETHSADFPTTPGAFKTSCAQDVFVAKLNSAGSALEYSTCLGPGSAGASVLGGEGGIDVDSAGNAYVTGTTRAGFPIRVGSLQTGSVASRVAFVTKLNAKGSDLVYSATLGSRHGDDNGTAIAVDRSSGEAVVVGTTFGSDFPMVDAFQSLHQGQMDAFICRLNKSGSAPVYSSLLGGKYYETGVSVALQPSGVVYVAGTEGGVMSALPSGTHGFPITRGAYNTCSEGQCLENNAFVARILPVDSADMAIVSFPSPVAEGTNLIYSLTVANIGSQDAVNVKVADSTPAGLTFASNAGACATAFPCSLGRVASGQSLTIISTFSVPSTYSVPRLILNTATVSTPSSDWNPSNDSATATASIEGINSTARTAPLPTSINNSATPAAPTATAITRRGPSGPSSGTRLSPIGVPKLALIVILALLVAAGLLIFVRRRFRK